MELEHEIPAQPREMFGGPHDGAIHDQGGVRWLPLTDGSNYVLCDLDHWHYAPDSRWQGSRRACVPLAITIHEGELE